MRRPDRSRERLDLRGLGRGVRARILRLQFGAQKQHPRAPNCSPCTTSRKRRSSKHPVAPGSSTTDNRLFDRGPARPGGEARRPAQDDQREHRQRVRDRRAPGARSRRLAGRHDHTHGEGGGRDPRLVHRRGRARARPRQASHSRRAATSTGDARTSPFCSRSCASSSAIARTTWWSRTTSTT